MESMIIILDLGMREVISKYMDIEVLYVIVDLNNYFFLFSNNKY